MLRPPPLSGCSTVALATVLAAVVIQAYAEEEPGADSAGRPNPLAGLSDVGHSHYLVGLGLLLALTALLTIAVMGVVSLAAVGGAPVPLLAALPSTSAALLAVQLLARVAQEETASSCLVDLGRSLAWAAPPAPDWELSLVGCLLCGTYVSRRLVAGCYKGVSGDLLPHGLAPGSWELRALGLLTFPLSASAAGILLGQTQRPIMGAVVALLVFIVLVHQIMFSLKVVTEALEEGSVVRVTLPDTTGGEVFVDRLCDQLLALPVAQQPPGCPALFGSWPSTPAWCVAPFVAAVREVEQRGPHTQESEHETCGQWAGGNSWCSVDDSGQANGNHVEIEDEMQGRPLLHRDGVREDVEVIDPSTDGNSPREEGRSEREGEHPPPAASSSSDAGSPDQSHKQEVLPGPPKRLNLARRKNSPVALAHPVRVTTVAPYDVKSLNFVAGVACTRWLDCAVPASVLPRIEELGGDTELQVHPGQLTGPLTSGRFAACFDWGTRWPLRWTVDVALKATLGFWASAPLRGGPAPGFLSGLGHLLMLVLASSFTYGLLTAGPYEHRNDDLALVTSSMSSVFIILLRALGEGAPGLAFTLAAAAGGLALAPCLLALLAAMGLVSATLGQLEAQGLQDRCLPRTVSGWGQRGQMTPEARTERISSHIGSIGGCGPLPEFADGVPDGHAVEAVLPGQKKAFSIVLPAVSQLRVVHAQLLPPVANRNGDPECLPPCVVTGDKPRLPVPAALLFPSILRSAAANTALSSEVDLIELDRRRSVSPLLALLAPGHAGRLVYEEPEHNDGGADWQQAIEGFFGLEGGLLAEEAEKLVEQHAFADGEAPSSVLVVVEVLPAWAAEFVDERCPQPLEGA